MPAKPHHREVLEPYRPVRQQSDQQAVAVAHGSSFRRPFRSRFGFVHKSFSKSYQFFRLLQTGKLVAHGADLRFQAPAELREPLPIRFRRHDAQRVVELLDSAEDRVGRAFGLHLGDVRRHALGRHPVSRPHVRVEQVFRGKPGQPGVMAASDHDPRRGRPVSSGAAAAKQAPRLHGFAPTARGREQASQRWEAGGSCGLPLAMAVDQGVVAAERVGLLEAAIDTDVVVSRSLVTQKQPGRLVFAGVRARNSSAARWRKAWALRSIPVSWRSVRLIWSASCAGVLAPLCAPGTGNPPDLPPASAGNAQDRRP